MPPLLEVQSLNRWTTRQGPLHAFFTMIKYTQHRLTSVTDGSQGMTIRQFWDILITWREALHPLAVTPMTPSVTFIVFKWKLHQSSL